MNLTIEHFKIACLIVVVCLLIWWMILCTLNEMAFNKLARYKTHFNCIAKSKVNCIIEEMPGYDQAPCEVSWMLRSSEVRVIAGSWSMLGLLKGIKSGRITEKDLIRLSTWPQEPLP